MGVPGLWEILAPVGTSVSLHKLSLDAFEQNASGKRAYRLGIDASIWFRHACMVKEGENPELRTLFFRVKELAKLPILPLFVFDGRSRPKMKRGSKMGKSGSHKLTAGFKKLLDAFGMHWREAEGEAEAELAFLNRAGTIDAIMTDDVDCFLFGAATVIKNQSLQLSGNRSNPALDLNGKPSKHHIMLYNSSSFSRHPDIGLSRGGLILFALLTGGDYDKGVDKVGKVTAHALARSGLGDELDRALQERESVSLHNFLPQWRERINYELQTNSSGLLSRAAPGLRLPPSFPSLEILDRYANPAVRAGGLQGIWTDKELNIPRVAAFCEEHFEWATRDTIIRRFRTLIWDGCVIRILRRAALAQDQREIDQMQALGVNEASVRHCARPDEGDAVGTNSAMVPKYLNVGEKQSRMDRISAAFVNRGSKVDDHSDLSDDFSSSFIAKIHSSRQHVSTDRSLEYRIEIVPSSFVELANSGIKGTRTESSPRRTSPDDDDDDDAEHNGKQRMESAGAHPEPSSPLRLWCPAQMLWRVNPKVVRQFEERKGQRKASSSRQSSPTPTNTTLGRTKSGKRKAIEVDIVTDSDSEGGYAGGSGPRESVGRDSVRRRLFTEDRRAGRRAWGVEHLLSKVKKSRAKIRPVAHIASNPDISLSQHKNFMAPLHIAHKAAVLKRISSAPFPQSPAIMIESSSTSSRSEALAPRDLDGNMKPSASLFLFNILDPCDPGLIQREDLREPPDISFQWTDIDAGEDFDSDNDSVLDGEKELDRILQRNFAAKASASNTTFKLRDNPEPRPSMNCSYNSSAVAPTRTRWTSTSSSPSPSQFHSSDVYPYDNDDFLCGGECFNQDIIDISSDESEDPEVYDFSESSVTLINHSPTKSFVPGSQYSTGSSRSSSSTLASSSQEHIPYIDLCE